jgi:hypothetical protein
MPPKTADILCNIHEIGCQNSFLFGIIHFSRAPKIIILKFCGFYPVELSRFGRKEGNLEKFENFNNIFRTYSYLFELFTV